MDIKKLSYTMIVISTLLRIATIPQSIGYAYGPAHFYNLYLPNFGIGSEVSILPTAFRTLASAYTFLKVALVIFDDPLLIYRVLYIVQPLLTFLAFYLFFGLFYWVPKSEKCRILLSSILSLIVNWPSESYLFGALIVGMSSLFGVVNAIIKNVKSKFVILGLLAFLALSLYWHSAHVLFFILIFVILVTFKRCNTFILSLLVFIISVVVWIYVRNPLLRGGIISNLLNIENYINLTTIYLGLFSKGIFVPSEYLYDFKSIIPEILIDYIRYVTYIIIFLVTIYALIILGRKQFIRRRVYFALLLSTITFMLSYFIATRTIGPAPIVIFLFPYALYICISKGWFGSLLNKTKLNNKTNFWKIIFIYILFSFAFSEFYYMYYDVRTNPKFSENFYDYYTSSVWISNHLTNNSKIISDAATQGYIAIWYGKYKYYKTIKIYYKCIGNQEYIALYNGLYNFRYILIYNIKLYEKNLALYSLEAWNKYKPLPPIIVQKNKLNIVYNDQRILIMMK